MLVNSHLETTSEVWPNSNELKEHLSLPLALSLQPFAHDQSQGSIHPEHISKYRCQSCKAFINQLCFIRSQNEYDCALCGCTNYLENEIDIGMPELNNLSYCLPAPDRQRVLTTRQRLVVFLLDLSNYGHESKEYLLYAIHVIREFVRCSVLNNVPIRIVLLGFDSGIIRYVINPPEGASMEKIVTNSASEQEEDYLPQSEELIGDVTKGQENIFSALDDIEECVVQGRLRNGQSTALMPAIKLALNTGEGYSGKIFLVTGLRNELSQFNKMRGYEMSVRHGFALARKQCISPELEKLVQSSQLSLWIGMLNNQYVYNMPFHYLTKMLNGELSHYFPTQHLLFFHQFRQAVEELMREGTSYETLMRVRYSTGLKMVGMFGSFRPTKVQDQVDLLTCPSNRRYIFEFMIQGRIASDMVLIQFSTLCTSLQGQRYFLIETHCNKVSSHIPRILSSTNYNNVNGAYVRGIVHNLDLNIKTRQLQLVLQERCKRHIRVVRETIKDQSNRVRQEGDVPLSEQHYSKIKPYIVLTFLMMKHFLLNSTYPSILNYDLNAILRSQIATRQDSINIIWPMVYSIDSEGWSLVEMQQQGLQKATVAIFVDRCDQQYVHLRDPIYQGRVRTAQGKQILLQLIDQEDSLATLKKFIEEFKKEKGLKHIDMLPLEDLSELKILDMNGGRFGYDKFIEQLTKQ